MITQTHINIAGIDIISLAVCPATNWLQFDAIIVIYKYNYTITYNTCHALARAAIQNSQTTMFVNLFKVLFSGSNPHFTWWPSSPVLRLYWRETC